MKKKLAMWISLVFHPLAVCIPSLFLATYLSAGSFATAAKWFVVAVIVFLMPLLAFYRMMIKLGQAANISISKRQHRHDAYLAGVASTLALLTVFIVADAPHVCLLCLYSAIIAAVIGAIVNSRFTKISLHSIIIVGCATAITFLSLPIGAIFIAIAVAVGWARLELKMHTITQVLLGWLVGVASVVVVFGLYL